MANVNLPDFFNPLLAYLSDNLPPPLYSFLINAISHVFTLFSAILSLVASLSSRNPLEWDAQTVLPPIITLFAAYFALISFYRTTTWVLRTSVFFVKWGTIFGVLIAGVGWIMGDGNSMGKYGGIASGVGNFILEFLNGPGKDGGGTGTRSGSRSSPYRTKRPEKRKPKAWDSFERHQEWQYEENQADRSAADAQKVISDIIGAAGNVLKESGWWNVVKNVVEARLGPTSEGGEVDSDDGRTSEQSSHNSQAKTKAGRSRSR